MHHFWYNNLNKIDSQRQILTIDQFDDKHYDDFTMTFP